jgi:hypothetical protein
MIHIPKPSRSNKIPKQMGKKKSNYENVFLHRIFLLYPTFNQPSLTYIRFE